MKIRSRLNSGWWYRVQRGDSLWKIAQKTYRNGAYWTSIYNYRNNRSIIGPNPNLLRSGLDVELW